MTRLLCRSTDFGHSLKQMGLVSSFSSRSFRVRTPRPSKGKRKALSHSGWPLLSLPSYQVLGYGALALSAFFVGLVLSSFSK